jgi:hypothetical protein
VHFEGGTYLSKRTSSPINRTLCHNSKARESVNEAFSEMDQGMHLSCQTASEMTAKMIPKPVPWMQALAWTTSAQIPTLLVTEARWTPRHLGDH